MELIQWAVDSISDHKCDPKYPNDDSKMSVAVRWTGPWKDGWHTLGSMNWTMETPMVRDYFDASKPKPRGRKRRLKLQLTKPTSTSDVQDGTISNVEG